MNSQPPVRYRISMFRTIIGWSFGVPWSLFMGAVALFGSILTGKSDFAHATSWYWSRLLLWLTNIKVDIQGLENFPKDIPVLIVSNHQSLCDILVASGYFPLRFSWIAKRELFRIPIFGRAMKAAGYISIDRSNREKAIRSLNEAAKKLQKSSILIYPEGTRTRTGKMLPFKRGVIHVATKSRVPILPITITNSFERMPPDRKGILPGTIRVTIDPLIYTKDLERKELPEIFNSIHEQMTKRVNASQGLPS